MQASYFSRDDQALLGFAKYFEKASGEEREHGLKLMRYQVKRGGKVVFQDIAQPSTMEWGTALEAMEAALELEKTVSKASSPTNITLELYPQVNQSLLDLHKVAAGAEDAHLCDFLESEYLTEQVEAIKEIGDWVTRIKRAGDGLGLHTIDQEIGS